MEPAPNTGQRLALLVATWAYNDPDLRQLRAPGHDATELAEVLRDPRIGGFDVQVLINPSSGEVQEGIEDFCTDRHPGDQLMIYLSCHGVLDSYGRLYYAAANTRRQRLATTAVAAAWLNERLEDCRARRQILVLDCCHSGAFAKGAKGDSDLGLQHRFEPQGRGRVVLTASRSTEYSFEGSQASGEGVPSVFTHAIVNGLRTGDADRDKDGLITVTDLYQYVFDRVRAAEPRQTPELWTYGAEGNLLVAHSIRGAVIEPEPLPEDLRITLESPRRRVREMGVAELADLLDAAGPGLALAARQALERIAVEDHPQVAELARIAVNAPVGAAADQVRRELTDRAHQEERMREETARREAAETARREAAAVPPTARQADFPTPRQAHTPTAAPRVSAAPSTPSELKPSGPAAQPGETQPARRWLRRHAAKIAFAGLGVIVAVAILVPILVNSGGAGPETLNAGTLNYYSYPDASGATAKAVASCNTQSHGKYTISFHRLSVTADVQRQQLAHLLAAHDKTAAIMGLDVTWVAEFAQAGWILPWTGINRQMAESDTLNPTLDTATWHGKLYAAPANTNTQLLWYRSDLVKTPPTTWDEMISDAEQLAGEGKPHYIEVQGAPYEGTTIWFNTLVTSAGGSILTPDSQHASLGPPAVHSLEIMKRLATSVAADPSLPSQMEVDNWRAMESGKAAFELNYPFVYPAMKADHPKMFKHFKWAPYPEVVPGQPASVTVGGIDLAVSAYSSHPQAAFQAALCLRNRQNQLNAAIQGGLPPVLESLYHDPILFSDYPFHADLLKALKTGSVRPKTPAYQAVSADISHLVSPPAAINPTTTEQQMISKITKTLQSNG
jgi:multiple sugar transport system substrate-binding protein